MAVEVCCILVIQIFGVGLSNGGHWHTRPIKHSLLGYAQFGRLSSMCFVQDTIFRTHVIYRSELYIWLLWPVVYFYASRVKVSDD